MADLAAGLAAFLGEKTGRPVRIAGLDRIPGGASRETYRFTLDDPGERLRVVIHETRDGVPILDATLAGERVLLTDRAIVRQVLKMPLMTFKVVAGIHWEALKIWLRGGRFHGKPAPPEREMS